MAARMLTAALLCFPSMFVVRASSAPVLVEEPADTVAIPVGQVRSANLTCRSNSSASVIEWYKDGVAVEMASLPWYNITNTSLVVETTDRRDDGIILEGLYYCVISNAFGAARSRSALVKTQRLVSSIRPLSGIYYSNETVALFQLVYTENPVVQWSISCHQKTFTCPGVSCSLWHRVSVVGRLLLYSLLRLTFSGIKTSIPECETTDSVGITASTFQQVDFIQFTGKLFRPLNNLRGIQTISVEVGDSATLYCIYNHRNSTYTWDRDGFPIPVANHSRYSYIIDGVLQIHNVMQTDGGLYICSATAVYPDNTQHTRSNTMINLIVYSLPNVSLTLVQDRNSSTNCDVINPTTSCRVHPVSIVCQFNGSVPLLVQILHNDVNLFQQNITDNQRSVQHNATNHLSSGVYQCIANNPYGSTQTSLYVLVQGTTDVSTAASSTSTVQQTLMSSTPVTRKATQVATSLDLPTSNTPSHSTTQHSSEIPTASATATGSSSSFPFTLQSSMASSHVIRSSLSSSRTAPSSIAGQKHTTTSSSPDSITSEATPFDTSKLKRYTETPTTPASKATISPLPSSTQSSMISSYVSMSSLSSGRTTPSLTVVQKHTPTASSPMQMNSDSDSTVALKVLVALGWTLAGLVLCVNIIIIVWVRRHYVTARHKSSHSADRQEDMKENSAYSVMPLGYTSRTPRQHTVEYEEVRTARSDSEHHHYETPGMEDCMVATNTSL